MSETSAGAPGAAGPAGAPAGGDFGGSDAGEPLVRHFSTLPSAGDAVKGAGPPLEAELQAGEKRFLPRGWFAWKDAKQPSFRGLSEGRNLLEAIFHRG